MTEGCCRSCLARSRRAFTLVELLVVVSVIALLIGLLLPALSRVRATGRMTLVLSNARQLQTAHAAYTNDWQGRMLPGYTPPTEVAYDQSGEKIERQSAQRYVWRLAPYFNWNWDLLFYDIPRPDEAPGFFGGRPGDEDYLYSVHPQFGLNTVFVGGSADWSAFDPEAIRDLGRYYVARVSDSPDPSRQVVFASSIYGKGNAAVDVQRSPGFHEVEPPYITDRVWDLIEPVEQRAANDTGYVGAKWSGQAIVTSLDGHAAGQTLEELDDMRAWAPLARSRTYTIGNDQ